MVRVQQAKMNLFSLENETAIVVGGTGVLGGRMAEALAENGARVAIVGRNAERGEKRVATINAAGGSAVFLQADALKRESLEQVNSAVHDSFGLATVLVNATGGNRPEATLPPGSNFCDLPLLSLIHI